MNKLPASLRFFSPLLLLLFLPTFAHAHVGLGQAHGFSHGFAHPILGLDHIVAMLAIGLWASQLGGRSLWAVPLTFVSVMAFGGLLGILNIGVPMVEQGILASVFILGLLIAGAVRLPMSASVALVALFAIFHGHAHGAEMPENASGLAYGLGFMLATAGLHLAGIGLGWAVQKWTGALVSRLAGGAIVGVGVFLFLS